MNCNDIDYITFTNIQKLHSSLLNSKVSKNIRNQGETLFCWAFAISTMIRQSLNLFIPGDLFSDSFISKFIPQFISNSIPNFFRSQKMNMALKFLNSCDSHRQLRNELVMIPIPKILSNEYNESAPLSQGHYIDMALERVSSNSPSQ